MDTPDNEMEFEKSIAELRETMIASQQKTFKKWINNRLQKEGVEIHDLVEELRNGKNLLKLLRVLSGQHIGDIADGDLKIFYLENVEICLNFLRKEIHLPDIEALDIVDGNQAFILGLIWNIIRRYDIEEQDIPDDKSGEKLLEWAQKMTMDYTNTDVQDFKGSWSDGLAFNALIHAHKPHLFAYEKLSSENPAENLQHAFEVAYTNLGVPKLLDIEDFDSNTSDEKCVMAYIASIRNAVNREEVPNGKKGTSSKVYFALAASIIGILAYFVLEAKRNTS